VAILAALAHKRRAQWLTLLSGPAGTLVYGLVALGVLRYFSETTRYSFIFYPFVVATLAAGAFHAIGLSRGLVLFAAAFAVSGDFDPRHIRSAGGQHAAFRTGPFTDRDGVWYPRRDYESVAEHLSRVTVDEPDSLFVVSNCPPVARAFDHANYATYLSRSGRLFYQQSRLGGARDVWNNRLLLSTPEDLREASRYVNTVRLVREVGTPAETPESVWGDRLASAATEFMSPDNRIEVLRIRLRGPLPADPVSRPELFTLSLPRRTRSD
ncbi:MAG: hypothetical protein MI861_22960, partial [Pirellulales bacterium]|nr:hypothetical protein [Pirellulales bacterium]